MCFLSFVFRNFEEEQMVSVISVEMALAYKDGAMALAYEDGAAGPTLPSPHTFWDGRRWHHATLSMFDVREKNVL